MPYIKPERREYLNREGSVPRDAGELNYMLTMRCLEAFHEGGIALAELPTNIQNDCVLYLDHGIDHSPRYEDFNAVMGALDCCKREFQRRRDGWLPAGGGLERRWAIDDAIESTARRLYREAVAPYEDAKIIQNGDVY